MNKDEYGGYKCFIKNGSLLLTIEVDLRKIDYSSISLKKVLVHELNHIITDYDLNLIE